MYALLLAIIYIAFVSLGLPDSLLGAGWPAMHIDIGVSVSSMGIISMVISGGTIISSLLADRFIKKVGTRFVTLFSVVLTALAIIGFSFANQFWILILLAIPFGLGAGAIDAALNNYVALHYSSRHLNWLHACWGVGAIISPFIMGYALTNLNWHMGYRIVGFIQLAIAAILLFTLPIWKKANLQVVEENKKSIGIIKALKIKGVPLILIGFFAYCAAEATAMGWASTYFVEVKNMPTDKSAMLASLFFIGITVGRFLCGFISDKLGDKKMIFIGTCLVSLGIIFVAIPSSVALAIAGFIIIGFGCAPIYPCIIHSTPKNFGDENSGAIIGIQMASAYIGSTFMPPLFGIIGASLGFWIMPIYLAVFVVLMLVFTSLTFKVAGMPKVEKNDI